MGLFFRACSGALIAVILVLFTGKTSNGIGVMVGLAAVCGIIWITISYLSPVVDFVKRLRDYANLDDGMLSILLKAVGIGLTGEIGNLICTDAGNASLGKSLQILSTSVILWMSIPLFSTILDLIGQIMEGV